MSYGTPCLGSATVFIRGEKAISDLFRRRRCRSKAGGQTVCASCWALSLANPQGADHKPRPARVVGPLFARAALSATAPAIRGVGR